MRTKSGTRRHQRSCGKRTSSRMGCLLDALDRGYRVLGLDEAAGGDGVFRQLVLARIIEPASKIDSLRVLEEAGEAPPSLRDAQAAAARLRPEPIAAAAVAGLHRA